MVAWQGAVPSTVAMPFKLVILACSLALAAGHAAMGLPSSRAMHGQPIQCYTKGGKKVCNTGCSSESCL